MGWRKKALVRGSLAGLVVGGVLFAGAVAGGGLRAAAGAAAESAEARAQASIGGGGGCRWELAHVSARHDGPGAASLRTATMLLDQCSGRTWILVAGPRAGLEWRGVGRDFWPE